MIGLILDMSRQGKDQNASTIELIIFPNFVYCVIVIQCDFVLPAKEDVDNYVKRRVTVIPTVSMSQGKNDSLTN